MSIVKQTPLKDFEDLKSRSHFIPKGHVIPKWLMRTNNKHSMPQSSITAGCDLYILSVNNTIYAVSAKPGHELMFSLRYSWEQKRRMGVFRIAQKYRNTKLDLEGAPYSPNDLMIVGWADNVTPVMVINEREYGITFERVIASPFKPAQSQSVTAHVDDPLGPKTI